MFGFRGKTRLYLCDRWADGILKEINEQNTNDSISTYELKTVFFSKKVDACVYYMTKASPTSISHYLYNAATKRKYEGDWFEYSEDTIALDENKFLELVESYK